jgi:hypothetical protein
MRDTIDEVKIGDFSKPLAPRPAAGGAAAPSSSTAERLDAAEKQLAAEAEQAAEDLKPHERYERRLKDVGVTRDEAARIVDAILERGYWSEEVPITSRRKVKLRTRQYRDGERLTNYLEATRPFFAETRNEITYKYCLAASLEQYGETKFKHLAPSASKDDHDQAFQIRLDFLGGLADPALRILFAKLSKFDVKVATVTEEGAIENF